MLDTDRLQTPTRQVAASQQRQQIPPAWQREWEDWTNLGLESLCSDVIVHPDARAYARWELDYREAFGQYVDYHPLTGYLRRRRLVTEGDFTAALAEDAAIDSQIARGDTPRAHLLSRLAAAIREIPREDEEI